MASNSGTLTALAIKSASTGKHFDGSGLYLHVKPNGARYWRMKYHFGGKEKLLAFGTYPEVSLAEARRRHDDARMLLRDGKDPSEMRKESKHATRVNKEGAFANIANAWLASKRKRWADETYRKAQYVIETYLIPSLKRNSIATLTTKQAADAIESIAQNAPSLAAKARQYLGGITEYAIRQGLREEGRHLSLRGTVPTHEKGHIPAVIDPKDITKLLEAIDNYPTPVVKAALTLTMLTAMRPGTIAAARWSDIDLESGEWSIPAESMKMNQAHIVPLPKQAIKLLRGMLAYTGGQEFVFPPLARQNNAHLHRDALSGALRRMGFKGQHSTHGFRGMLRTVARERLGVDSDILEAQLAHAKKGDVQKAYDRTTFNDERRAVMQKWADYLDNLRIGGNVIPIKRSTTPKQNNSTRSAL